jgi:hypothetical protein
MKLSQALAALVFVTAKKLLSGSTITWSGIHEWIKQNGNPDLNGVGYSGNSLGRRSTNGHVIIRQEQSGGKIIVSANKTWTGTKLDSQLKKRFGDNLRFHIQV